MRRTIISGLLPTAVVALVDDGVWSARTGEEATVVDCSPSFVLLLSAP